MDKTEETGVLKAQGLELTLLGAGFLADKLRAEVNAARGFARAQHAASTKRAYTSDWRVFERWCAERGLSPMPASGATVAVFIASQAGVRADAHATRCDEDLERRTCGLRPSTITRRLAAIAYAHRVAGQPSPTNDEAVRAVQRGIHRVLGVAPQQKTPLLPVHLHQIVAGIDAGDPRGRRDCAIVLLGFGGAFRRSELAALDVGDLDFVDEGVRVRLKTSKTNQTGALEFVAIPRRPSQICAVAALERWLCEANLTEGALFRRIARSDRVLSGRLSSHSVGRIIKRLATVAGIDSALAGGHSVRAGFATASAIAGADVMAIAAVTRHKRLDSLRGYIRRGEEFSADHPLRKLL